MNFNHLDEYDRQSPVNLRRFTNALPESISNIKIRRIQTKNTLNLKVVQMVLDGICEAFALLTSVSSINRSPMPTCKNLAIFNDGKRIISGV